jgi:hypothetical protein
MARTRSKSKRYTKRRSFRKRRSVKRGQRRSIKRQYGGRGMTTSVDTNPIGYREDEYDQYKNMLNYNPSIQ